MDAKCPKCKIINKIKLIKSIKINFYGVIICKHCHSRLRFNMFASIISSVGFLLIMCSLLVLGSPSLNNIYSIILSFVLIILGAVCLYIGDNKLPMFVIDKNE